MHITASKELSSTDDVIEQSRAIRKEGTRRELRTLGKSLRHIIESTVQATGAVALAAPAVIHEAGTDVNIYRTAAGVVLGGLSFVSARKAIETTGQLGDAIEESSEEAAELLAQHRTDIISAQDELDNQE